MDNSIFEIDMITEGIYRISEYGMSNCYLIIGSSEALLIDTANGIGNLRNVVESITSLAYSYKDLILSFFENSVISCPCNSLPVVMIGELIFF